MCLAVLSKSNGSSAEFPKQDQRLLFRSQDRERRALQGPSEGHCDCGQSADATGTTPPQW